LLFFCRLSALHFEIQYLGISNAASSRRLFPQNRNAFFGSSLIQNRHPKYRPPNVDYKHRWQNEVCIDRYLS
jgi:hypothetical protein